jgi:O-antigen/teichoic acid export membrane protein
VANSLLVALILGSALAIGITVLAFRRADLFGYVPPHLIQIAAISIPFQLVTLIGLNVLLAVGRIKEFNLLDLTSQSFVLINALAALVILSGGLGTLVIMNTSGVVLVSLVVMIVIGMAGSKILQTKWSPDMGLLGQMLRYGLKFHISILAGALIFRADLLVVNHFRGPDEAGVYSVATQVGMMVILLPAVIATLLFPRITAVPDPQGETTRLVTRHTAFIMILCCLAIAPLSALIPVVYGASFADASIQLLILLPGVFFIGLESVLVQYFTSLGLPKVIPIFWLITLLLDIVLLLTLVPRWGARGAAAASTISYLLIFLLVGIRFRKTTRCSWADAFVIRATELRRLFRIKSVVRAGG